MPIAQNNVDFAGIASLANLFTGKNTTSSTQNSGGVSSTGSKTTSQNVSQDAVNALVKSILEGSQGLASVAKGQRGAGLYNSSTNQMLVNDLIARSAAEGAKLNKSETVTTNENQVDSRASSTNSTTAPPIKPATAATALGGLQAFSSLGGKKILERLGIGKSASAAGTGSSGPSTPINDGSSTSGISVNPNAPVATMDAAGNTQAVSSYANNPSAFVAGSNEQVVNSLTGAGSDVSPDVSSGSGAGDVFGIGDLGFDQTADFSGFDMGVGNSAGDSISELGGVSGDWGPDPSSVDFGSDFDPSDLFDFAEGGLVTSKGNETLIKKYASGGYVNLEAEKAFDSGGDEKKSSGNDMVRTRDSGVDFFRKPVKSETAGNDPRATQESPKQDSLNTRIMKRLGFADGGIVDITNTGLRAKNPGDSELTAPISGEQLVGSINARNKSAGTTSAGAVINSNSPRNIPNSGAPSRKPDIYESTEGTPGTGVSGTPESNQAAINGMIGLGITTALGIPGVVGNIAMNTMGIPNISMNPMSQLMSLVSGLIGPDGMTAAANVASQGNPSPTASDDNAAVANGIASDNDTDPLDALVGIVSDPEALDGFASMSNDGTSAEGGGIGGGGNSAGDANGGDGGNGTGDGGTASAARGGMIRGPGTSTSDSIPARLSDGEYVIKAAVVDHYGKDFFDRLNQSIQVA